MLFQSTRPRGARLNVAYLPAFILVVSIHAPAGGATLTHKALARCRRVSIHAPAGGATACGLQTAIEKAVSIHAPAGGATSPIKKKIADGKFQSTRPRGARLPNENTDFRSTRVSIHAPAGGATVPSSGERLIMPRFNPRARGGRDCYLHMHLILNILRTPFREPFLSHLS